MRFSKMWIGLLAVGIGCVMADSTARAQADDDDCVCERREWVGIISDAFEHPGFGFWERRARLGVLVETRADPEIDSIGARIQAVTPGGPADDAGLRAGDIVTSLNGESLLTGDESYDQEESAPGRRLVERAKRLEPGDTVTITYRRDGDRRNATLVAGGGELATLEFEPMRRRWMEPLERLHGRLEGLPEVVVRGPNSLAFRLGARLPGLELVSVNEGLGEYFGTDEGVLVVSIPEGSGLNLMAGDVILKIGDRDVKSPSHAMRILRSYDPDEEVDFQIMRKKQKMNVNGQVPEESNRSGELREFLRHYEQ